MAESTRCWCVKLQRSKEVQCGGNERLHTLEEFTVRHFLAKVAPEHFNRVKRRAVSRQVQEHQPPCSGTDNRLDFVVFVRRGVVPGHVDDLVRMLVNQCLQQFGDLAPALMATHDHHGLTGVVVHRPDAIVRLGLSGRRDHDLLALGVHIARRVGSQLTLNSSA